MAATLSRKPFGNYSLIRIGNEETYASFIPERSAYIHEISLGGRQILWNYPDAESLEGNSGHRNLALVPFPNRLLEGTYSWKGESQSFPVNKPDTRSALHGFGPHARFTLDRVDLAAHGATARMTYLHQPAEHPTEYPYRVLFAVEVMVDIRLGDVTWRLDATNLDDIDVPIGLGWHPYYLLPGGHEQAALRMPPNEHVVLKNAIPTGAREIGLSAKQDVAISTDWDDCYVLTDEKHQTVTLRSSADALELSQLHDTRYTQLYVPPDQGSVAVEPMSCAVNAFQDEKSEVRVSPGDSVTIGTNHHLKSEFVSAR